MTDHAHGTALRPFVARCRGTALRPVRPSDADALFEHVHRRRDVVRWLCWSGPETLDDLRERYRTWRYGADDEPAYIFAIERARDGAVIGEGSLRFDEHPGVGELGYWLGEAFHGEGHGREAVELLTRVGFELCGAFALTARVKEGNDASIRVLNRTGFERTRAPAPDETLQEDDPPIAWIFSTTRRADARRGDRPEVSIETV
jgi:RimJ/RimL family protein N-acetyltransferase